MPNFNYLGKKGFPHADNVDVYAYSNDIDYSRYDYTQMTIQVCNVPWEQGEARVGQRTLSGIGNVVYFGSEAERDAWFDAIPDDECYVFETKFKELHSDLTILVPLPFDVACNYNYVRVTYNLFANDGSPLEYENENGKRSWFYFIREAKFDAPNRSRLTLLDDAWQTWIYDLDITSMILERGHAPMFRTKADDYLKNPIKNCSDLLAEDINYGELQQVAKSKATVLNSGDMYAVVATSAYPPSDWGTKTDNDWKVPASSHNSYQSVPNVMLLAMEAGKFNDFMAEITANTPQFKQTVQGVFFVAKELISVATPSFTFGGVTCWRVTGYNTVNKQIFSRTKADWGYGEDYEDIAKLYTWPYSALEITDEKGNSELVRIEDTSNALTMDVAANLVFPYLKLSGLIKGIGGASAQTVSFTNLTSKSVNLSGRWYEHLREWDVPSFCVILSAAKENDYSTHFTRLQANNDRTTAKTNADALANTAEANSKNTANASYTAANTTATADYNAAVTLANAQQTCSNNEADNVLNNATAQKTANNNINNSSNQTASSDASLTNALSQAIQAWDAGMTRASVNNEIDKANASAAVGAAGAVANSAAGGAISGAMSGGAIGAIAGAIGGLVSGGIGAATSLATNSIAVSAMSSQAEAVISNSQSKVNETSQNNTDRTNNANSGKTKQKNATNTCIQTTANNTASTIKENATTTRTAQVNAANTRKNGAISAADTVRNAAVAAADALNATQLANNRRTYDNEGARITNQVKQAALKAPFVFGSVSNAEYSTTRPLGLFVNIVTESDYAIQRAGDEFLRYGYYYDKQWEFSGDWLLGKHYTFWKLRDYWSNTQIPDVFADQIRFLLFGGVTVWGNPEDIGSVNIYDNWKN